MSVLLVLCHPDPRSLNHAAAEQISAVLSEEGVHTYVHDLYSEHFEPVLEQSEIRRRFAFDDRFAQYAREIRESQGLVFVYPDWWGMPPAMLKGWIDRIFSPGIAFEYEGEEFGPKRRVPLLGGKKALLCSTTDETNPLSQSAIQSIWRERVFAYSGIETVEFKTLYNVRECTGRRRKLWLSEIGEVARRLFSTY